jgi:hypothetical protein
MAMLTSAIEQTVPYVAMGANIAGVRRPNMAKGQKIPKDAASRTKKVLPFTYTHVSKPESKGKGGFDFGGTGGDSFDFGGDSGGFDFSQ